MSKHTPGPWQVVEHSWSDTGIYSDKHHIAHLSIEGVATESNQSQLEASMDANAKLIAAAPELLNAVRFLLSNPDNRISPADIEAANAAIAKATT